MPPTGMERQLLNDPALCPSEEVQKHSLGGVYPMYELLMRNVAEQGLTHEWRYYNDGKAWLCKVVHKKKTVFWLSVWEGYFKTSFFFTKKHAESIAAININEKIKEDFCRQKTAGKLLPMIFNISHKEQLPDVLKVVAFKKNLK